MKKSTPRITGELAEKAFLYQLHTFSPCRWIVTIIVILVVVLLEPAGKAFFAMGPQVWYMTLLKLPLILVPGVFAVAGVTYLGFLLGAALGVILIRLLIPQLHMPEARSVILQFYSDPRWLDSDACVICGPMRKNKRLIRWCKELAATTISHVYGTYPGVPGWGD